MTAKVKLVDKKDAFNFLSNYKVKNRPCDEFYLITSASKSTNPLTMKEVTTWIGRQKVNLVVCKIP